MFDFIRQNFSLYFSRTRALLGTAGQPGALQNIDDIPGVTTPFRNLIILVLGLLRWVGVIVFIVCFVQLVFKFKDQDSHNVNHYAAGCFAGILLTFLQPIVSYFFSI